MPRYRYTGRIQPNDRTKIKWGVDFTIAEPVFESDDERFESELGRAMFERLPDPEPEPEPEPKPTPKRRRGRV